MSNKPVRRDFTTTDLENARTKGQIIGWVQGGLGMIAGLLVLRFLGWIPTLIVVGILGFLAIKLLTWKEKS